MVAGVDEQYKEGFDYSSSLGDWSVGGLNKQLQNSVGGAIRNALFFPDPLNKFSPAHVEECLNVMNPEIADPHHYPRKKETLQLSHAKKKRSSLLMRIKPTLQKFMFLRQISKMQRKLIHVYALGKR